MVKRKKLYEILCCFLHPLAVVLIWFNLPHRRDLSRRAKLGWGIFSMVPVLPFFYVLGGHDLL